MKRWDVTIYFLMPNGTWEIESTYLGINGFEVEFPDRLYKVLIELTEETEDKFRILAALCENNDDKYIWYFDPMNREWFNYKCFLPDLKIQLDL